MTTYSLAFFSKYRKDFWTTVSEDEALGLQRRALLAGCKPVKTAELVHGVPVAFAGPSMGEVLFNLERKGVKV